MAFVNTTTVADMEGEWEIDVATLSGLIGAAIADRFGLDTNSDDTEIEKLITDIDPVCAINIQVTGNTFSLADDSDYTGINFIINNTDDKLAFTFKYSEITGDTDFTLVFDDAEDGSVTTAVSLRDFQVTGGYSDRVNRTSPSGDLIGPARLNIFGGVNKAAAASRAALNNNAHVGKTLYAPQEGVKDWRDEAFDSAVQGQDNWGTLAHAQDNPIDGTATHVTNAKSKNGKGDGHTGVDVDNE